SRGRGRAWLPQLSPRSELGPRLGNGLQPPPERGRLTVFAELSEAKTVGRGSPAAPRLTLTGPSVTPTGPSVTPTSPSVPPTGPSVTPTPTLPLSGGGDASSWPHGLVFTTSTSMAYAEIGVDHGLIGLHLRRRTVGDLDAVVEHQDTVGQVHDHPHVVLDQ